MEDKRPLVFISYSWDNEKHKNNVKSLADKLVDEEGIDCLFDQYCQGHNSPSEGWPTWIENGIDKADYVLLVCTEGYLEKYKQKSNIGKGVKFEGAIIKSEFYNDDASKFISIIFQEEDREYVPRLFTTAVYKLFVDNLDSKDYDFIPLRCHITKQSLIEKPPLGDIKERPPLASSIQPTLKADNIKDESQEKLESEDEESNLFSNQKKTLEEIKKWLIPDSIYLEKGKNVNLADMQKQVRQANTGSAAQLNGFEGLGKTEVSYSLESYAKQNKFDTFRIDLSGDID